MSAKDYTPSPTIEDILAQLTPMHLSFSTRSAEEFTERVGDSYKEIRGDWLKELNTVLNSGKLSQKDHARLEDFRDQLIALEFANTQRAIKEHSDGEIFVKGEQNLKGRTIDLFSQFSRGKEKHDDIQELELICDMLVRSGVERINVFAPYLPYQREDKKDEGRVPLSAKVMFNKIYNACYGHLGRIVTYDIHAPQAEGFTNKPVEHLSAMSIFARYFLSEHFKKRYRKDLEFVVVSPDAGGAKRAEKFAKLLGVQYTIVDKARPSHGEADARGMTTVDIEDKIVIMVDDMIDTAGSLVAAAEKIHSYNIKGLYAVATHALLSNKTKKGQPTKAVDKLSKAGVKIVITDSVPYPIDFYEKNRDVIIDVLTLARPTALTQLLNRLNFSVSKTIHDQNEEIRTYARQRKQFADIGPYLLI